MIRSLFLLFLLGSTLCAAEEPLLPFVLPWDDASPGVTNVSAWLEKPAGKNGFITSRDSHLYSGDKRFRIFGVNLCFGANFPKHEDAEKIAARMAKFGINCVRFHHMDMFETPRGILQKDMKTLDPGQLDKLDYFISKLKEQGIYSDLNLHVSRTYPGMPEWEGAPGFLKGVDLFYPPMLEMQRDYAKQLLTHVNPYTKLAYINEPAIALVEINNENGLICEWWAGTLDNMPPLYVDELKKRWNTWLSEKYPDPKTLESTWNTGVEALGPEILGKEDTWNLEQHLGAKASLEDGPTIRILEKGAEAWHVQISHEMAFDAGKSYTLSFRAKADKARQIGVVAAQAHEPWKHGWSSTIKLTTEWKEFRFAFPCGEGLEKGRLLFSGLGAETGVVSLDSVSLRTGGTFGLKVGDKPGDISPFLKKEFSARSEKSKRDWMAFLWDVEEGYWTGMADFVREELKGKSLLVGTATGFRPSPIQARLDVVDAHAYWQHPHFPGKSWDIENWTVNNIPMAGEKEGGTLSDLALRRVAGKPYIITEYNASAPNTYGAETFLLVGAYGALQDWDGIFPFAYSHRGDAWDYQRIPGFFDIDQHPVKMATLPAAVAMFMRGDVAAAKEVLNVAFTREEGIAKSLVSGPWWNLKSFDVAATLPLQKRTAMQPGNSPFQSTAKSASDSPILSDTKELVWNSTDQLVMVNTEKSKVLVGKATGEAKELGKIKFQLTGSRQNWAALTLTAMDGSSMETPGRLLLTASGWTENTGMLWKDEKKNTVGKNWGKAPSLVEGISAKITLPLPPTRMKVRALDEKGQPGVIVPLSASGTGSLLEIGPQYKTLWYQIEVQ